MQFVSGASIQDFANDETALDFRCPFNSYLYESCPNVMLRMEEHCLFFLPSLLLIVLWGGWLPCFTEGNQGK